MILIHIILFYRPLLSYLIQGWPVSILILGVELIGAYLSFKSADIRSEAYATLKYEGYATFKSKGYGNFKSESYGNLAAGIIGSFGSGTFAGFIVTLLLALSLPFF